MSNIVKTQGYVHGVLVELTGIIIEVILLLIMVPVVHSGSHLSIAGCHLPNNRGYPRADKESVKRSIDINDLQRLAKMVIKFIDVTFRKRKKLIDSMIRHRHSLSQLKLLTSLPYFLLRRKILVNISRFRRRPYRADPRDPTRSLIPDMLVEWRTKNGFSIEQAAKVLGMPEKEYRDYEYGYREPDMERFNTWRKHLRGDVDYSQLEKETEPIAGNSS